MSSSTSFTSLLAGTSSGAAARRGLGDRISDRTGSGLPKFKSLPPPSLSPPSAVSPSSWFAIPPGLSPAELLDSPILLSSSNILPSPTTGSFPVHNSFGWKSKSQQQQQNDVKYEERNNSFSDFSFQTQTNPLSSYEMGEQKWGNHHESSKQADNRSSETANYSKPEFNSIMQSSFSPEISAIQTNDQSSNNIYSQSSQTVVVRENRKSSEDGYNWRKYGQKQVKGSENPRSYYKCTYPNCPTKKKVERSFDGPITEIVYKGSHNHPKPQSTRKPLSSSAANQSYNNAQLNEIIQEHSFGSNSMGKMESLSATQENSSISVGDDDLEQSSAKKCRSVEDEIDDDEPDIKRWKGEIESEGVVSAVGNIRAVREPRVVVQTTSDIDILVDGYRWRKYGQKVVKGNPNPRSYYKCTSPSCPVRKHVERASHDPRAVITTYEGKHNHDVPAARGSGTHSLSRPMPNTINHNNIVNNTIRPSSSLPNNSNHSMLMSGLIRPPQQIGESHILPYSFEMLQSTDPDGSFGYNSDLGNSMISENGSYSRAKDEPRDDIFLDSFLY